MSTTDHSSSSSSQSTSMLQKLTSVERLASTSKLQRLLNNPIKYLRSIVVSKLLPSSPMASQVVRTQTFWGEDFVIQFPAAIDIYLTGGKTHDSELRLTRYLILNLEANNTFIDIGSHFGFFAVLASKLMPQGTVVAIEPSSANFKILEQNVAGKENITALNIGIASTDEKKDFYEFPALYSEYNSIDQSQYTEEEWYSEDIVSQSSIQFLRGDTLMQQQGLSPDYIKIDVEGAEAEVIMGLSETLKNLSPVILLEFASSDRSTSTKHIMADQLLRGYAYLPHAILPTGELERIKTGTDEYVDSTGLESDNIAYLKK